MRHHASTSDDNSTPSPAPAATGTGLDRRAPVGAGTDGSVESSADADASGASDAGLADVVERLCGLLGDSERLERLSDDGLRDRVRSLRRLEGQTAAAMAAAVRMLTTRGATRADGASSATAWLRSHTGRSARAASRMARLASSLDDMPATAAALATGRISAESADALVHAARDTRLGSPDQVETRLLPVAETHGPEQVRAAVRDATQQADTGSMLGDEQRQHALRRLSLSPRDDGMWDLYGRLPAEVANATRTLLDIFDTPDHPDTPEGHRRRPDQRLADAWATAVDVALSSAELPTTGGISRPHLSVLVDLDTFDTDLTDPHSRHGGDGGVGRPVAPDHPLWAGLAGGQTAWSGTLSPQATRRLCCDAGVSRIVMAGDSQVLDVGRTTRTWTPAQRRAINARDRHCRGPGCYRPIGWTQIHHLRWWRHGGPTDLDNGLALCHACHRLVHDLGWHAELDLTTAAVTWTSPDRRRTVVTHPRQPG